MASQIDIGQELAGVSAVRRPVAGRSSTTSGRRSRSSGSSPASERSARASSAAGFHVILDGEAEWRVDGQLADRTATTLVVDQADDAQARRLVRRAVDPLRRAVDLRRRCAIARCTASCSPPRISRPFLFRYPQVMFRLLLGEARRLRDPMRWQDERTDRIPRATTRSWSSAPGPGGLQLSYELRRIGVEHALISQDEGPGGMFRRFPLFHRLEHLVAALRDRPARVDGVLPLRLEQPGHGESPSTARSSRSSWTASTTSRAASEMHDALVAFAERAGIDARYELPLGVDAAGGRLASCWGRPTASTGATIAVFAVGMSEPWRPPTPGIELVSHYDDLKDRDAGVLRGQADLHHRQAQLGVRDRRLAAARGRRRSILGSPHHVRPSIVTGVPTPPRARYLEVLEDHLLRRRQLRRRLRDRADRAQTATAGGCTRRERRSRARWSSTSTR